MSPEVIEVEHCHAPGFPNVFRERCSKLVDNFFNSCGILLRSRTVAELRNAIFLLQKQQTPERWRSPRMPHWRRMFDRVHTVGTNCRNAVR